MKDRFSSAGLWRALGSVWIYTGKRQAQAKGKIEKIFDYLQRRLPYHCEKHEVKDLREAQKILDDLIAYYNDQRVHEETQEIPKRRWDKALQEGKSKLRPLESSIDLERIFSIHLQRKARKDGTIMFMGKKWAVHCPEGTTLTVCLIPNLKFMIYKEDKKLWDSQL